MFEGVEWIFFDMGNTLFDEQRAFERRLREMARTARQEYEQLYEEAAALYEQHQKGDLALAQRLGIELPQWHKEDEFPYEDAEEGISKPNPRIFQIALEKSGCVPARAVMIGDRVDNDIIPAKAMGMYTIWLRRGLWRNWRITSEQEKADCVVYSPAEICRYL